MRTSITTSRPGARQSTAITTAAQRASGVASRFAKVETEARRIFDQQTSPKFVKAVMNGGGLHAVITDGATTLEIMDGAVALSVSKNVSEE